MVYDCFIFVVDVVVLLLLLLLLFYIFLENALGMDVNGLPTVTSTCKCLRMTYGIMIVLQMHSLFLAIKMRILHFRPWGVALVVKMV